MAISIRRGVRTNVTADMGSVRSGSDVTRMVGQAKAQAFDAAAAAANEIGATVKQWQDAKKADEKKQTDADLIAKKGEAERFLEKARFDAKESARPEDISNIMYDTIKHVKTLGVDMRTPEGKEAYSKWVDEIASDNELWTYKATWNKNKQITEAKNAVSLQHLTTSATDINALANNKMGLVELAASSGKSEEEQTVMLTKWHNTADSNFANNLLKRIDLANNDSIDAKLKLEQYDAFIKNSNSLTEPQKAEARVTSRAMREQVRAKELDEDVEIEVVLSRPTDELGLSEFSSRKGYVDALKDMRKRVDTPDANDYTSQEKAYVKAKSEAILSEQWRVMQQDRTARIVEYIDNPSAMVDLTDFKDFSPTEKKRIRAAQAASANASFAASAAQTIHSDMQKYKHNPDDPYALIQLTEKIESQPPAHRAVWQKMLSKKIKMHEKGADFSGMYEANSRLLDNMLKLTGKDVKYDDADIDGIGEDLTYLQRQNIKDEHQEAIMKLGEKYKSDPDKFKDAIHKLNNELIQKRAIRDIVNRTKRTSGEDTEAEPEKPKPTSINTTTTF